MIGRNGFCENKQNSYRDQTCAKRTSYRRRENKKIVEKIPMLCAFGASSERSKNIPSTIDSCSESVTDLWDVSETFFFFFLPLQKTFILDRGIFISPPPLHCYNLFVMALYWGHFAGSFPHNRNRFEPLISVTGRNGFVTVL